MFIKFIPKKTYVLLTKIIKLTFFLILAAIIFTTYFEDLVALNADKGYFITDNESMRKFVTSAIKISLNGVSLTVISFTIVFLFHSVGGKK